MDKINNKPRILIDRDLPSVLISNLSKYYDVHLWAGNRLYNNSDPIYQLAKASGVNDAFVFYGDLSKLTNKYTMFITKNDEYINVKGFNKWTDIEDIYLGKEVELKLALQQRWVTNPTDSKSKESCPICISLNKLGWVDMESELTYSWPGGSKVINGLPPYRQAHSVIGEGVWKVGDDKCNCYLDFRMSPRTATEGLSINFCDHKH